MHDPANFGYKVNLHTSANSTRRGDSVFPTLGEAAAFAATQSTDIAAIEIVRVWTGERTPTQLTFTQVSESMKYALKCAIRFLETGLNADGVEHQTFRGQYDGCEGLALVSMYYRGRDGYPVVAFETEWLPEHEQVYERFHEQRQFTQEIVDLLWSALEEAGAEVYSFWNGAGTYSVSYGIRNKAVYGARNGGYISREKPE